MFIAYSETLRQKINRVKSKCREKVTNIKIHFHSDLQGNNEAYSNVVKLANNAKDFITYSPDNCYKNEYLKEIKPWEEVIKIKIHFNFIKQGNNKGTHNAKRLIDNTKNSTSPSVNRCKNGFSKEKEIWEEVLKIKIHFNNITKGINKAYPIITKQAGKAKEFTIIQWKIGRPRGGKKVFRLKRKYSLNNTRYSDNLETKQLEKWSSMSDKNTRESLQTTQNSKPSIKHTNTGKRKGSKKGEPIQRKSETTLIRWKKQHLNNFFSLDFRTSEIKKTLSDLKSKENITATHPTAHEKWISNLNEVRLTKLSSMIYCTPLRNGP